MSDDLLHCSAVELTRRLRDGSLGCAELMEESLAGIASCNPQLNAIVSLDEELARAGAKAADTAIAGGAEPGPLHGLPFAFKDLQLTAGIRTTRGSPLYADFVPDTDSLVVKRIRDAGAIAIGKTNVPEFGAGSQTFNRVFGTTLNPYDPGKTCGGSSGGAAVALAARMLPLADGSDLGGSLRNPASFCNVVGFRPTPGRVPNHPVPNPWFDLSISGPMARSIDDLALLFSVMAGPDPSSPTALTDPGAGFRAIEPLPLETLKVAYSPDLGGLPVAPEIRERIAQVANQLRDMGVTVEQACPDLRDATRIFHVLRAQSFRARFSYLSAEDQAQLKDTIIWNMQAGQQLTHEDLDQAWVARTALFNRVAEFFRHYDFLLGPTTQVLPFDVDTPWVKEIDGVAMEDYLSWMHSCTQLTVTSCPAVSLPAGFSADGLPIGAQLVAPVREDLRLLRFAKTLEGEISSADHPPEICA